MMNPNQVRTKFLLILLISFFSVGLLKAQDYYESKYSQKPVSLGITFSPNLSWLRYGNRADVERKPKVGYGYGLLADFALSENYYFSSGFIINNLKSEATVGAEQIPTTYDLQYMEIPFGLKLKSTQRYYRSYYGQFGFTGGIKLSGDKTEGQEEKEDLGSAADIFRLGLQVGGGIEWQLDHNLKMMTGLSFNNGFMKVLDEGKPKSTYVAFNFAIFF